MVTASIVTAKTRVSASKWLRRNARGSFAGAAGFGKAAYSRTVFQFVTFAFMFIMRS